MNYLSKLFGNKGASKIKMVFHKAANELAETGVFYADHVKLDLKNYPIRFAFMDLEELPRLDREVFNAIVDAAEAEGFIFLGLRSYGNMRFVAPQPVHKPQSKNILPHPSALQPRTQSK